MGKWFGLAFNHFSGVISIQEFLDLENSDLVDCSDLVLFVIPDRRQKWSSHIIGKILLNLGQVRLTHVRFTCHSSSRTEEELYTIAFSDDTKGHGKLRLS